jgi:F0F1-type ATP synthase membrane subunit b/b'
MKELPDDGQPRTAFVRRLRQLREDVGAPTYRQMATATGYSQADFSALFNVDRLPTRELLADAVSWLKGDSARWLRQLGELQEEEARLEAAARGPSDDPQVRITELTGEVERLNALIQAPDSTLAVAHSALEQADQRLLYAAETEHGIRQLLLTLDGQVRAVQESTAAMQDRAQQVLADAERQAEDQRAALDYERDRIHAGARISAAAYMDEQREAADRYLEQNRAEADAVRVRSYLMIDTLVAAAEKQLAEAQEDAAEIINRAEHDAQRAAGRLKAQAEFEIERIVRDARQRLDAVGDQEAAARLETLLRDFNIGGRHELAASGGRHRRRELVVIDRRALLPAVRRD